MGERRSPTLWLSHELIDRELQSLPEVMSTLLVLLTDGKANVGLAESSGDPWQHVQQAAGELARMPLASLVVDTEEGFVRLGLARQVAAALQGEYRLLNEVSAEILALEVRRRFRPWNPLSGERHGR